jgi:hypothetical protein
VYEYEETLLTLGDYSEGVISRYAAPLQYSQKALTIGENYILDSGILKTRPGYSIYSTGSLPLTQKLFI